MNSFETRVDSSFHTDLRLLLLVAARARVRHLPQRDAAEADDLLQRGSVLHLHTPTHPVSTTIETTYYTQGHRLVHPGRPTRESLIITSISSAVSLASSGPARAARYRRT
jgi:hypothetical protein